MSAKKEAMQAVLLSQANSAAQKPPANENLNAGAHASQIPGGLIPDDLVADTPDDLSTDANTKQVPLIFSKPIQVIHNLWYFYFDGLRHWYIQHHKFLSGRVFVRLKNIDAKDYQEGIKGSNKLKYHYEKYNGDDRHYKGVNLYYSKDGYVKVTLNDFNEFLNSYAENHSDHGYSKHWDLVGNNPKTIDPALESRWIAQNMPKAKPSLTGPMDLPDFDRARQSGFSGKIQVNLTAADSKGRAEVITIEYGKGENNIGKEVTLLQNDFNKFLTTYAERHYYLGAVKGKVAPPAKGNGFGSG